MLVDEGNYESLKLMVCCLNPDCQKPINQDNHKYCQSCGTELTHFLRNRFRIIRPLGQGGFGKTYLAEDSDKLKEKCVVKQLVYQAQGSKANKVVVDLFMQEAEQLQQLWENPQIPSLFAYFEEKDYLYLVQQYIEGQDLLKELEEQGCFNDHKIQELLTDLLPVLEEIHNRQVIHRDIKPENIMRRKSDGKLLLIDFGVSKQLSQSIVSVAGTMVGSLGYAAPEQIESGIAHPSSDLYSLGVSCFHLMTDIHPWSLWKKQGYGWLDQWRKHLQKPVSPELDRVFDKLFQIEAEDRYQTASAMLMDLSPQPQVILGSSKEDKTESRVGTNNKLQPQALPLSPEARQTIPETKSTSNPKTANESVPKTIVSPIQKYSINVVTISKVEKGFLGLNRKVYTEEEKVNIEVYREVIADNISIELAKIPCGKFTMGSPAIDVDHLQQDNPPHQVSISPIWMGKYAVTQAQWKSIASLPKIKRVLDSDPSKFKGTNRPVEKVSWYAAEEFCARLSKKLGREYRLPSEAEWEYACRAGTTTPFHFGATITPEYANYLDPDTYGAGPNGPWHRQTTNVGSFFPNAFGLHDTHGNVWEWCLDTWHDNYVGAPCNEEPWIALIDSENDHRILRGGAWGFKQWQCRSAYRGHDNPSLQSANIGFRVVCSEPIPS